MRDESQGKPRKKQRKDSQANNQIRKENMNKGKQRKKQQQTNQ